VWVSFVATVFVWAAVSLDPPAVSGIPVVADAALGLVWIAERLYLRGLAEPVAILVVLCVEFGSMALVSLLTRPLDAARLDAFYARLLTPVGREQEMKLASSPQNADESITLGMEGLVLDYKKAARLAYQWPRRFGFEIPRLGWFDWGGFVVAWGVVFAMIGMLIWLAGLGG
jgi:hypothetical protein